jgi:hypothetical protein
MGYFVSGTRTITVCRENAQKRRTPFDTILKHEYVHFVYDQKGPSFDPIPEPILTFLVRELIPSDEVIKVLTQKSDYSPSEEFVARLLSEMPDELFVLWAEKVKP